MRRALQLIGSISVTSAFVVPGLLRVTKLPVQDKWSQSNDNLRTATRAGPQYVVKLPFDPINIGPTKKAKVQTKNTIVETFFEAWNKRDLDTALSCLDGHVQFEDASFPSAFCGKEATERHLRLLADAMTHQYIIDEVVCDNTSRRVGVLFHVQDATGMPVKNGKGTAFFALDSDARLITNVFLVQENSKSGESNLRILKLVSNFWKGERMNFMHDDQEMEIFVNKKAETDPKVQWLGNIFGKNSQETSLASTLPEQYFEAWNRRDMEKAVSLFSESVEYDDTAFPAPFKGRAKLEAHLNLCAKVFPTSFSFVVDEKAYAGEKVMVRWHVENNGEELPFTRGCSFYKIEQRKIVNGVDIVEPAVFKTGGLRLFLDSLTSKLLSEPVRFVPLGLWCAYMYVVFFSDRFFGLPVTALEQRTWMEVRDLSLNFFLVSPLLNLPFSPVVHPMLEGVFNILLSWAALFAGFLSDERRDKPNMFPMLPMVAGMQFLTSAFLLPYLVVRSRENSVQSVFVEDLPKAAQVAESSVLGASMATVGSGSILWGILARTDVFGGWNERLTSFLELLSIDRVGSSFIVDLIIFALFQGWLIDDDLKRRGGDPECALSKVAKYLPFFGMAAYMTLRPALPSKSCEGQ